MERTKLKELNSWFEKPRRKPLVLWGARQVGKTFLVKDLFAEQRFDRYVYIDLKKDDAARDFFKTTSDASKYLSYIEARFNVKVAPSVPLILDEVQECSSALSALKYFKQDYPDLPVIVTGSLVRLAIRHEESSEGGFLFPVGAINSIDLYPMTYEEYLLNTNKVLLARIEEAYAQWRPLEHYEHLLALDALYEYLAIGGMPEALATFVETGSYLDAREALDEVYDNYLSDMGTYGVSAESILRARRVYNNIFAQLNKENRNFKVFQIEHGKSNRDYFNAYQWLELARVVHRSHKLQGKVSFPLREEQEGLFRLYLADPGLFAFQSKVNQSSFMVKDRRNTLAGVFYESYVADELVAQGVPLYYWVGKRSHEFEFIVECDGYAVPIDVKKGGGKLNSLDDFRSCNGLGPAIKVSSGNFGYDANNKLITVPLYAASMLAKDLSRGTLPQGL